LDGAGGEDPVCSDAAAGSIRLSTGERTIVYFKLTNGTLTALDSGASTSVAVYAGNVGNPFSINVANP